MMPAISAFYRHLRLILSLCFPLFLCALAAPGAFAAPPEKQLFIYNWSEYIPDSVLENFTRETGIRVTYETFETNEEMYEGFKKRKGQPYDIIVPSGYYVDKMRREGALQRIDHAKIPNLFRLDYSVMDLDFDPENRFSIPYMWGVVGLAYNTKHIPKGSVTRWSDLQNPAYRGRIIMTDDMRDAFGLALLAQGRSSNSKNARDIKAGYDFLVKLKPSVLRFDVTAIKDALLSEEAWIAPIWNGDYLVAREKKPELDFVFPAEGALLWVDGFVIPEGAKNVENAHVFINYMLRPEVALACVTEYRYSTPNLPVRRLLPDALRNDTVLIPGKAELRGAEYTTSVGEAQAIYEKYWQRLLKMK